MKTVLSSSGTSRSLAGWGMLCLLLACLLAGGCGYRLGGAQSTQSQLRGKTVRVSIFTNKTFRPNLETILALSLREQISLNGGGKSLAEEDGDLVIEGTVTNYSSTAVSFTADDRVREYRTMMTVEAILRERASGKVLWKGTETAMQEYPAIEAPLNNPPLSERLAPQNRIALQQNSEDAAARDLSRKLARQIYQKVNAGF